MSSLPDHAPIEVLGLGYVGLPLALASGRARADVIGFDLDGDHITALKAGHDRNGDVPQASLADAASRFTADPAELSDPCGDADAVRANYGNSSISTPEPGNYDAIIVAIAHTEVLEMGADAIRGLGKPGAILYDIKGLFDRSASDMRL